MTTTINKLEKIGKYFMKEFKLYYIENNEEDFMKEVVVFYIDHKLYTDCELQAKRNLIAFIQNENEDDDLPNMVKYYFKNNEENLLKEAAKYYMKIFEEFKKFLKILFTNETTKKMCEEFLKEEEEFDKCLKEFFKCLEKIFSLIK